MQNVDQTPVLVAPLSAPANPHSGESNSRRSRMSSEYVCRSGPRGSRNAAVRESCASFRLSCSLQAARIKRPVTG